MGADRRVPRASRTRRRVAHVPSARSVALAALTEWRQTRRFADAVIQQELAHTALSSADRGFAVELFYGVLRNLTLLDFWIGRLRPGRIDDTSRDLLRLGLYQLFRLRTPAHAAVFETVELAPRTGRSFINAILRSAMRRGQELTAAALREELPVRMSHPQFLVERWTDAFGRDAAAALCSWNNEPAPLYARLNELKTSTGTFAPGDEQVPGIANFVQLRDLPLEALERGDCYIQDPSTRVACQLLDPQAGESVLDACAAPGGKTALLAEMMQNRGELIACDREPQRLDLLSGNLQRLGVTIASVVQQDWAAATLPRQFDGRRFDRILVDAPCTNTGVLRRRVDLRWRLQPGDFVRMPNDQAEILRAVVPFLKPGGTLVYSTCSIEAEENELLVERVLREFSFLKLEQMQSVLPFRDGFDGAFAARLLRRG